MSRKYPIKDVKLLFSKSAGRCNYPDCRKELTVSETEFDPAVVVGIIAHINAHSKDGPRANSSLEIKDVDAYPNWILLCGYHHDLVDKQPNTYTVEDLHGWKVSHEQWVKQQLTQEITEITFAELDVVTKAILNKPQQPVTDFDILSPSEKIKRNNLTENTHALITIGLGKSREVKRFVNHISKFDSNYPERLKAGFVSQYNKYIAEEGLQGDELFDALLKFSSGFSFDFRRQAAGLAVLTYMFQLCEVFEK